MEKYRLTEKYIKDKFTGYRENSITTTEMWHILRDQLAKFAPVLEAKDARIKELEGQVEMAVNNYCARCEYSKEEGGCRVGNCASRESFRQSLKGDQR